MDITILNRNLIPIDIIDTYSSAIWTDRYNSNGDFEISVPASEEYIRNFKVGSYLTCDSSEHAMIVEKVQIKTDADNGDTIIISGRSVESILDRRIIWGQHTFDGDVEEVIFKMLDICLGQLASPERRIENIEHIPSNDSHIRTLRINLQCTGDNLYDVITKITKTFSIGFKMVIKDRKFIFSLYNGKDYSEAQLINPYVIFSPHFDNMLNSNFMEDISPLKTSALIGGEGEGHERKYMELSSDVSGVDRREMFVDARDVSSRIDNDHNMSLEEYNKLLTQRGLERLTARKVGMNFEGKIESSQLFVYGKDYNIGDIVQIENAYGCVAASRITEAVISYNSDGFSIYPTLQTII